MTAWRRLRFTDSVAQISNLDVAPLAPAVAIRDSVVWIHDSQLEMHRLPYCRRCRVPSRYARRVEGNDWRRARSSFVAGGIVFASPVFNQIDPLVP